MGARPYDGGVSDQDGAGDGLWETHAEWWIDGFTDGVDPEYEEQILPLAARELAGATHVLDVGCGDGQVSRLAARLGAHVVGIDPTWNCVRVAHERGGGAFARAGAAQLPFPDATFDAVVACLVFEHIRDVDAAIAEEDEIDLLSESSLSDELDRALDGPPLEVSDPEITDEAEIEGRVVHGCSLGRGGGRAGARSGAGFLLR